MDEKFPGYKHLNIVGFTVDAMQPLALFKDETEETTFPLWLQMVDVLAITADLITSRLTDKGGRGDLLDTVLGAIGYKVTDILIDGTATDGYMADVCLDGEREVRVRVELVTALLAAIKYKIPVAISEEALSSSSYVDQSEEPVDGLPLEKDLLAMLERMNPEDMLKA